MTRRVDQIQNILLPVLCLIRKPGRLQFDRNAALALDIHIIQILLLHISSLHQPRLLNEAVSQGGLSVIYVCNNAEIPNIV